MKIIHLQRAPLSDFWSDIFGAGRNAAQDLARPATDAVTKATSTINTAADLVGRFDETQRSLVRLDNNVNALKPVIWGSLIVSSIALGIIAYKQFK